MSVFADARFRRLLLGSAMSAFGDSALYLTLAIWAKDLTGSNGAAGAIFLAQGLPYLASPLTGHWVDRVRRKPLMLGLNLTAGVAVLSLLAVDSKDKLWILYAFAAFYGAVATVQAPARAGLLKDFVADKDLAAANAAFATVSQGLRIASPLVGAALYAKLGGGAVAVFDAATFAFAAAMLASVRVDESPVAPPEQIPVLHRLFVGARYVNTTPALKQMLIAAVLAMLVLGFYESLTFAVIAALGKPASFFGAMMSVQGFGSILGGLLAARVVRRLGESRTLGIALMLWAVSSIVYAAPALPVVMVALLLFGVAVPLYAVSVSTAAQRFAPARMQGRVVSTVNMSTNLSQTISIAVGAVLVDVIDYRLLLLIVAFVAALAAAPVLFRPASAGHPDDPGAYRVPSALSADVQTTPPRPAGRRGL